MKHIITLSLLLAISFGTKAQSVQATVRLADSVLTTGDHKVYMITYQFPERIEELRKKAMDSLSHFKSKDLITTKLNLKLLKDGTSHGLHFRPEFGLTRSEFDSLLNAYTIRRKAFLGDTLTIHIVNENGFISFAATGPLAVYNLLLINTNKDQVIYNGYFLTREVVATGPYYAPPVNGYELLFPVPVDKKNTNQNTGIARFCIGRDKDTGMPTLVLMFNTMPGRSNIVAIAFSN